MTTFSEIGHADRDYYDECVGQMPEPDFRQTFGWGEVRAVDGWTPRRFVAMRGGLAVGCAQLLVGELPHLPFRLIQVPAGPLMDYSSPETVKALAELLREVGRESGACFARIEPQLPDGHETAQPNLVGAGFARSSLTWSFWNAPLEVLRIDLRGTEESLFRQLSKHKRKDIGRFGRRGNTVGASTEPEDFWRLYQFLRRLGSRKGFFVRGRSYWQALWDEFVGRGQAALLVARRNGEPMAYKLLLHCGRTAVALHGADVLRARPERPNEALSWASIQHAHRAGCSVFDMMGYVSETHLQFKQSFGAELVRLTGYYDLPIRPLPHWLFASMEKHLLPRVVPAAARLSGWRRAEVPPDHGAD